MSSRVTSILTGLTTTEVRLKAEEEQVGMMEAKRMVKQERLFEAISHVESFEDVRAILYVLAMKR